MSNPIWRRVSRANPCPVCGRPDWCLISADGAVAICARIESPKRCGEAGWLHRLTADPPHRHRTRTIRLPGDRVDDFGSLAAKFAEDLDAGRLHQLAVALGLNDYSLVALGTGWAAGYGAFSFPMGDASGRVVGIRLRRPNGRKFAVRGGREGLFLPPTAGTPDCRLLVCEGPTDAAALLDLGYANVIGRPSCTGGVKLLTELVKRRRVDDVAIVADADEPGRRGAENLATVLACYAPTVRVVVPPAKDVREFLRFGGTAAEFDNLIDSAPVRRLRVSGGPTR